MYQFRGLMLVYNFKQSESCLFHQYPPFLLNTGRLVEKYYRCIHTIIIININFYCMDKGLNVTFIYPNKQNNIISEFVTTKYSWIFWFCICLYFFLWSSFGRCLLYLGEEWTNNYGLITKSTYMCWSTCIFVYRKIKKNVSMDKLHTSNVVVFVSVVIFFSLI